MLWHSRIPIRQLLKAIDDDDTCQPHQREGQDELQPVGQEHKAAREEQFIADAKYRLGQRRKRNHKHHAHRHIEHPAAALRRLEKHRQCNPLSN